MAKTSLVVLRSAHAPKTGEAMKDPIELIATAHPVIELARAILLLTKLTKKRLIEGKTMEKQTEAKKVMKSIIAIPIVFPSFPVSLEGFEIKGAFTSFCSLSSGKFLFFFFF